MINKDKLNTFLKYAILSLALRRLVIFAASMSLISELLNTKVHDETRQGESFAPFPVDATMYVRRFYIESYGCQMNFSDSEIVASILMNEGFGATRDFESADLILLNTCSIREKAEQTVRKRLTEFRKLKRAKPSLLVGVLGCMAERLKSKFLEEERLVDLVIGPDAYRTLPSLIAEADGGQKGVNVLLSREETYADIAPVRLNSNGITAFVSIMRGCNNMCSFCVVPFTRGRERSRDVESILNECRNLFDQGYKEVTLLGQNVDSYYWVFNAVQANSKFLAGISPEVHNRIVGRNYVNFADLLELVALVSPDLRVRFSTSHPKDITDEVLHTMARYENICKYIHLPLQSGSSRVLQLMNRTYTKEWYLAKINRIKEIMPDCSLSSDIIAGFCTEEEEDHRDTLEVMRYAGYDLSYMFFYSERPGTLAQRRYKDDIALDVKKRRLQEIVQLQNQLSLDSNRNDIGKTIKVLIEGDSKKTGEDWMGRTSQNKVIVFAKTDRDLRPGDYVDVEVSDCTKATLLGKII